MRVVSVNLNGIRSAANKGFYAWLEQQAAEVVCMQEVKAQAADLTAAMSAPPGWHAGFHFAEKKGYSGVGIYSRRAPDRIQTGFGSPEFDAEGRYVEMRFGALSMVSVYFPSGASAPERQQAKFRFLDLFFPHLETLKANGQEVLLCGDWNIAHQNIDLKNWKSNQKNSGFLPEERAWLSRVFDELGYVDVFRTINAEPEQYTWWSNRGQAWAKNVGWRIDYHVATPALAAQAQREEIYKTERFSDHAPLVIDYARAL